MLELKRTEINNFKHFRRVIMIANSRQLEILEMLSLKGAVTVEELSDAFNVSKMTIRRDLEKLEESKLLQRTHGGAFINKTLLRELTYHEKTMENSDIKKCIAAEAVKYIEPNSTLFLDAGTTTYEIALRLPLINLTVITNDIRIASQVMLSENKVILLGGLIHKETGSTTDYTAIKNLDNYSIDLAIIATSSIDSDFYLCTPEHDRQIFKQKAIDYSHKKLLVVDSSKFFSKSLYRISNMRNFDMIITDFPKEKLPVENLGKAKYIQMDCPIEDQND
jgi:DeoR family transcriptional regulator, fructose operon transcriptional repressor